MYLLICEILLLGCSSNPKEENIREPEVRPPAVAGAWYPANKQELQLMVQGFLDKVKVDKVDGDIYGFMVPHAGYVYSGQTAAYAFKQILGRRYNTVILIGPPHRAYIRGVSIYAEGYFKTPLGLVEVDADLSNKIIKESKHFSFTKATHIEEHSLEAELPFLQMVLKDFKIVPVLIGQVGIDVCEELSKAILKYIKGRKDVLIVASSDMSHYPRYEDACVVDNATLESIKSFNPYEVIKVSEQQLNKGVAELHCTLCGELAVITTMMVAKGLGANEVKVLNYANSGDLPIGDKNRVVGYGAVAFYKKEVRPQMEKTEFKLLDEDAQKELLRIARTAIESYVKTGKITEFKPKYPVLNECRGVFVTLTENGQLRGCIGHHDADVPLSKLVPEMAISAACKDYRFAPVSETELKDIKIKISVYLCKVYEIKDISEYEPGVHGIIMIKGNTGATFLPEVPVEENWTREQTLAHLCQKAGLPPDAWKQGAKFYLYKTQVFSE
ncbi:MAG: AmmeMemoRadiSam system protein B [bacterium]|nr:AmmeMemoRadiSam system protein B [bacterium]